MKSSQQKFLWVLCGMGAGLLVSGGVFYLTHHRNPPQMLSYSDYSQGFFQSFLIPPPASPIIPAIQFPDEESKKVSFSIPPLAEEGPLNWKKEFGDVNWQKTVRIACGDSTHYYGFLWSCGDVYNDTYSSTLTVRVLSDPEKRLYDFIGRVALKNAPSGYVLGNPVGSRYGAEPHQAIGDPTHAWVEDMNGDGNMDMVLPFIPSSLTAKYGSGWIPVMISPMQYARLRVILDDQLTSNNRADGFVYALFHYVEPDLNKTRKTLEEYERSGCEYFSLGYPRNTPGFVGWLEKFGRDLVGSYE